MAFKHHVCDSFRGYSTHDNSLFQKEVDFFIFPFTAETPFLVGFCHCDPHLLISVV